MKRVLLRADESADWKIAGLRQLDRLALTLNEFAQKDNAGTPLVVAVQWNASIGPSRRWLPNDSRLTAISITEDVSGEFDMTLSTHQLLSRDTLACVEIASASEIEATECRFLRASGKSQDGLVSRFMNRPISRAATQRLLKTRITPNEWSIMIVPLVIVAAFCLRHGSYASILFGLVLFQVFSILDGCDGEIARAKFMESKSGRMLDDLSDIVCNVLLVFGLGLGLGHFHRGVLIEGMFVAVLIGVNELALSTARPDEVESKMHSLGANLYPRHRSLVANSGLLVFGERFAYWLIQLTKRDVSFVLFILLAALGWSAWILHLLLLVNAISLALALKARFRPTTR